MSGRNRRATITVSGADVHHSLATQRHIDNLTNNYDLATPQRPDRPARSTNNLSSTRPPRPIPRSPQPQMQRRTNIESAPPGREPPRPPSQAGTANWGTESAPPSREPPRPPSQSNSPNPHANSNRPLPVAPRTLPTPPVRTSSPTLSTPPTHSLPTPPSKGPPTGALPTPPDRTLRGHSNPSPTGPPSDPLPQPRSYQPPPSEALPTAPTQRPPRPPPPTAGGFSRPQPPSNANHTASTLPQHTNNQRINFVSKDLYSGVDSDAAPAKPARGSQEAGDRRASIQVTKSGVPMFPMAGAQPMAPLVPKDQKRMKKMKDKLDKQRAKEEKKKEKEEAKRKEEERKKAHQVNHTSLPAPVSVSVGEGSPISPARSHTMSGPVGGGSPLALSADPRKRDLSVNGDEHSEGPRRKASNRFTIRNLMGTVGLESSPDQGVPVVFTTEELFKYVREGNANELRKCLAFPPPGFNISQQIETKSGDNLLHAAVSIQRPNEEIVKILLKSRIDINTLNKSRLTPLFCAVMIGAKPKIVSLLLEAGASIDAKDGDDNGLLHTLSMHAPQDNQLKSLEKTLNLLMAKGVNINALNSKGLTPVMLACYSQNMLAILLKRNPDLSIVTANGDTVLHMVVRARAMPSLGLLLSKNADPRLGTPPAIDLDSNPQIKGLLLEKIQEIESGRVMVQRQASAALLKDALSNGGAVSALLAETNKKEKKELRTFSSLIEALQQASVAELKKYLTATGSSPAKVALEKVNDEDQTALHVVCARTEENADLAVVTLLLKQKQVSANVKDSRGWTPLHCCVFSNANTKILAELISAGAETNATTVDGTRPIDYYVRKEPADWKAYAEGLDMLLQDSSINIKNLYSGETCLHCAVRARTHTTRVVQMLLARGADPNIGNSNGETALHYAVKVARVDLVEILVKVPINTADPRKNSSTGTPLDWAKQLPTCPESQKILSLIEERFSRVQASENGNPRELMLKKLGDVREQRKLLEERLTQIKDSLPQLQQQLKEEQEREKKLRGELDTLRRQRS